MSKFEVSTVLAAIKALEAIDADDTEAFNALAEDKNFAAGAVGLAFALLQWRGDFLPEDVLFILRERLLGKL